MPTDGIDDRISGVRARVCAASEHRAREAAVGVGARTDPEDRDTRRLHAFEDGGLRLGGEGMRLIRPGQGMQQHVILGHPEGRPDDPVGPGGHTGAEARQRRGSGRGDRRTQSFAGHRRKRGRALPPVLPRPPPQAIDQEHRDCVGQIARASRIAVPEIE